MISHEGRRGARTRVYRHPDSSRRSHSTERRLLKGMELPRFVQIEQRFPNRAISDIPGRIRQELSQADFTSRLKPGSRLAIGVGSRGISNIATIVKSVVDFWKERGVQPFLFPAMGSHGAATAE